MYLIARLSVIFLLIVQASACLARHLPEPGGEVILRVAGMVTHGNADGVIEFDLETLSQLPLVTFETETIWTTGPQEFTGVPLSEFLTEIGAEGSSLKAAAINDYTVSIPVSDAVPGGPIIAIERNGQPMSVRDKGPLWIVYPYDSNADYRTEVIFSRSIWQLDRIIVGD